MVGCIVPPMSHHLVCNIVDIDSCYGLNNCLYHGCDPVVVTTTATSTSTSIIAVIIIIVITSAGGAILSMVALVLSPIIVLLTPSPLLGAYIRFSTTTLMATIGSAASVIPSEVFIIIVIICLFILFLFFWERGRWFRLLLKFLFTFA